MAQFANATLTVQTRAEKPGDWTTAKNAIGRAYGMNLSAGNGYGQIDLVLHDLVSLAPSGNTYVDLTLFTDLFNNTGRKFYNIKIVSFKNTGDAKVRIHPYPGADILPWLYDNNSGHLLEVGAVIVMATPGNEWEVDTDPCRIFFQNQSGADSAEIEYTIAGVSG